MIRRFLIVAALAKAAAIPASTAAADGGSGNTSIGSLSTAQVGSTGTAPDVTATTPVGPVTVTVRCCNVARAGTPPSTPPAPRKSATATAQRFARNGAGEQGEQCATRTRTRCSCRHGSRCSGRISNGGANSASGSVGTVQVGGDHSATSRLLALQVSHTGAHPYGWLALGDAPLVSIGQSGTITLGKPALAGFATVGLRRQVALDLRSLTLQADWLGVSPAAYLQFDPLARLLLGGWVGVSPNDGNNATGSVGTAQLGGVTVAPTLVLWVRHSTVVTIGVRAALPVRVRTTPRIRSALHKRVAATRPTVRSGRFRPARLSWADRGWHDAARHRRARWYERHPGWSQHGHRFTRHRADRRRQLRERFGRHGPVERHHRWSDGEWHRRAGR